jgi:hypothetical protein
MVQSMHTSKILARHPDHRDTESLWGYMLRVSQANGFRSIWPLIERSGMDQFEARGASINLEKLSAVTRKEKSRFQTISYTSETEQRLHVLLGHEIPRSYLGLDMPRICPKCILSLGFIEAHWDLAIMKACPVHLCRAVEVCPSCGERLRWFRPGLLRCHCGAPIGQVLSDPILPEEGTVLQLIRCKVLRLLPLVDNSKELPVTDLSLLEVRDLIRIIHVFLGCRVKLGENGDDLRYPTTAISSATKYLSEWPNGFFQLLRCLKARESEESVSIREIYAPLYNAFLRKGRDKNSDGFNFMRIAFLEFVSNHIEDRAADRRVMRSFGFQVDRRFVTRAEIARTLAVGPRAMARSIRLARGAGRNRVNLKALDAHSFEWRGTRPGLILGMRAAASELGIPVEVLRKLRQSGDYDVTNLASGHSGFHEGDIAAFKHRLFGIAREQRLGDDCDPGALTSLRSVLISSRHSAEDKADLLREILNGKLRAIRGRAELTADLCIATESLHQFLKNRLRLVYGPVFTGSEAALRLGCGLDVIRGLIHLGVLEGRRFGCLWLIQVVSVESFHASHVPVSTIATQQYTSSRKIVEVCSTGGIELLHVPIRNKVKLYAEARHLNRIRGELSKARSGRVIGAMHQKAQD